MKILITEAGGAVLETYALNDYVTELREDFGAGEANEADLRRWAWDAMTDEVQAAGARLLTAKKKGAK